jgi:hypothetical protein
MKSWKNKDERKKKKRAQTAQYVVFRGSAVLTTSWRFDFPDRTE